MKCVLFFLPLCIALGACNRGCVFDSDCEFDSYCSLEKECTKLKMFAPPPDATVLEDTSPPDMQLDALPQTGYRFGELSARWDNPEGVDSTEVTGRFGLYPEGNPCTTMTVGECSMISCDNGLVTAELPDAMPPAFLLTSAGMVDVSADGETLAVQERTTGDYIGTRPTAFWTDGDDVVINGAGGSDAPSFNATLKGTVSVTSEALPASVPQDAPLMLAWTGMTSGTVQARVHVSTTNPSQTLICDFAGSQTGTIPAATLAMLPAGAAELSLHSVSQSVVEKSNWTINLSTSSRALLADGTVASSMVQLTAATADP